jgi:hypothetical protein
MNTKKGIYIIQPYLIVKIHGEIGLIVEAYKEDKAFLK